MIRRPPRSTLFPSTPLSRSAVVSLVRHNFFDAARMHFIFTFRRLFRDQARHRQACLHHRALHGCRVGGGSAVRGRSEEHTSELQSLTNLVCRLLLVKKTATS